MVSVLAAFASNCLSSSAKWIPPAVLGLCFGCYPHNVAVLCIVHLTVNIHVDDLTDINTMKAYGMAALSEINLMCIAFFHSSAETPARGLQGGACVMS